MIQLSVGDDAQGIEQMPIDRFMKDYQFRVVTSPNQLVEKIRIFESGLDDRVVEFAKFLLRRGAALERDPLSGELLYQRQGRTDAGEEVIRFVVLSRERVQHLEMPMSKLEQIGNELGNKLTPISSEAGKWMTVNEDHAVNLARQF